MVSEINRENMEQLGRARDNLRAIRDRSSSDVLYQKADDILEKGEVEILRVLKLADSVDKQAAIFALVCLIEGVSEESERVVDIADALLENVENTDLEISKLASRAVIYLILNSKTFALKMLGNAFDKADRWCGQNKHEASHRVEPWILYRDLALFTATRFFERVDNFFDHIFIAIRDSKIVVREHAAQALHAALAVTSQREAKQKNVWYEECFKKACDQAKHLSKDDALHASLLLFNELLRIASVEAEQQRLQILDSTSSSASGSLIGRNPVLWLRDPGCPAVVESRTAHTLVTENYYAEIIERCILARSSKSKQCQSLLLEIFPRIVTVNQITEHQLNEFTEHALNLTSKYPQAFLSFGLLSLNHPKQLAPKVPKYFSILTQQLKEAIQKKKSISSLLFKSLRLVVRSQKDTLYTDIQRMLPLLLSTGLSEGLTEVFEETVTCIPALKTDVLDGLMEQLYQLLMNRQLPSKLAPPTSPPVPTGPIQIFDRDLIKLALKTLGSFDFQRHSLQMFMRFIALGYLVSNEPEIQLAAVNCCVSIVKPFIKVYDEVEDAKKPEVYSLIRSVLDCLIKTAITDPNVKVRLCVLNSFRGADHNFLVHLAQQETLDSLFMILNDEKFEMQEASAGLLAQLSELNPALILPKMRKLLNEKIYILANSKIPKLEEHSARIIINLAIHAPKFISLFMKPLLMVLMPHLYSETKNIDVTISVLNSISELALIGGLDIVKITNKLTPMLLNSIKDSTSLPRREAALRALGNLCQSSAYVIEPYKDHPELLGLFLRLLRTELSSSMHRLTMKVFGIIGALDPYVHKIYTGVVHSNASNSLALSLPQLPDKYDYKRDGSDIIQWIKFERCTLDEYYPTLAIINLTGMLHDHALSNLYQQIIEAIMVIFKSLGTGSSEYVNQVIPQIIQITKSCKPERREFFLTQFGVLASIIRQQLHPYIKPIFELIHEAWNWDQSSPRLRSKAVYVMKEIGSALGLEFTPYIGDVCPYLLEIVENERTSERMNTELITNTLSCIRAIVPCLSGHIHVVLPPVLNILDSNGSKIETRKDAVEILIVIARNHNISDRAASIMQTWFRCVREKGLQEQLVTFLMLLMSQMWTQYTVYIERVREAMERNKVNGVLQEEYKQLLNQIVNNPQNPPIDNFIPTIGRRIPIGSCPAEAYSGFLTSSNSGIPRQISHKDTSPSEISLRLNVKELRAAWLAPGFTTRDDWIEWLTNLRKQFLTYSPSPALSACSKLAFSHPTLATELFNAAFMSVWTHLNEEEQDEVTAQFVDVITMCKGCPEPVQAILNLAEFMDHSEKGPLPINHKMLMDCAEATRTYAKAIRYNESLIIDKGGVPTPEDCQTIITFANKLGLEEASTGIVQFAEKNNMNISGRWYEKLGEWEKALEMYGTDSAGEEKDETMIHQLRCLEALGRWTDLNKLSESTVKKGLFNPEDALFRWTDIDKRQKIAQMSARGCWAVGNYEKMSGFVDKINANNMNGSFLRAVLAIRNNQFSDATKYINRVRDMLDSELTSMAAESYERAYGAVVTAQQLTELEEAIEYKMIPERRTRIAILWSRRLQGCQNSIEHWQRILLVRSLVLSQAELRPMWVKFSSLCRREGKLSMSRRVLCSLMDLPSEDMLKTVPIPLDKPFLALAICKQNWADGDVKGAYKATQDLAVHMHGLIRNSGLSESQLDPLRHLTAKCYMKLGDWYPQSGIAPQATVNIRTRNPSKHPHAQKPTAEHLSYINQTEMSNLEQITKMTLQHYANATAFDSNWYKSWHRLGTMYYNFVMTERQLVFGSVSTGIPQPTVFEGGVSQTGNFTDIPGPSVYHPVNTPITLNKNPQLITNYAVKAVQCFVKAIQLAEGSRVEDTLRLLMIWFDHCEKPEVFEQLRDQLKSIPVETWLEVVPQLMSRMDSCKNVGLLVKQVVLDISKAHPQAIVYALTAATKSKNAQRCKVAREILRLMAEERKQFVDQACLISDEFIRCAILWHEQWHGALEEAFRLYFQEQNFEGMMNALRPLHEKIEAGHTTMKEESFNQTYFKELRDAYRHCSEFDRTGDPKEVNQALDLYYRVFRRISSQLRSMSALDLNYISPLLLKAQNLEVCVPGTYDPGSPLITISSIVPHLEVITSKQRPRKMSIRGSDGNEYSFLLKGNEDPRQDERIMQLFGLINHLILRDPDTNRRNLSIQRYSIIPLSQTSGLIGWIPNCDTLHTLIRDYREKKKIPVSIEHSKMQKLVIDIDKLTLMQKVEIFDEVLRSTDGDDIKITLWAHSPNSEVWFDRRTNYTRSIATSSMVGYILGLGDRHPSNLMLSRTSGKIVHIDFGDCFEVAMKRAKYPEKIPFRLTRMIVKAMEVTGIEGNYRLTCERVLRLLRNNHDSILAVLESFVYDPVLNWRLTESSVGRPAELAEVVAAASEQQQLTGSHSDAISRVKAKLTGRDFDLYEEMTVQEQVSRLIEQATLYDNLCQCYVGWCPFW